MRLGVDLLFSEQVSAATESAFVQALAERGESAWTADPNVPNWSTIRGGSKVVLLGVNSTIVPYRPMLGTVASCPARSFFIQVAPVTWSEPFALGWTRSLRLHHPFAWLECSSWAARDSLGQAVKLEPHLLALLENITFTGVWFFFRSGEICSFAHFAHRNDIKVSGIIIYFCCVLLLSGFEKHLCKFEAYRNKFQEIWL